MAVKFSYVCPGCGNAEVSECEWSGETRGGTDEYQGAWIECVACAMQGPKMVWDKMARRRADMEVAMGLADLPPHEKRYLEAIEAFGRKMFRELRSNDPKKGDFMAWSPKKEDALSELTHHVMKLESALNLCKKMAVTEYCADLANVVMGIDSSLGAK